MRNIILLFFSSLFLISCASHKSKSQDSAAATGWAGDMQNMARTLEQLMPYVFSREEFHSEKNRSEVKKLVRNYSEKVHVVKEHVGQQILGDDPLVKYTLKHLKESTQDGLSAFNEGHTEYARQVLANSVGACFNCHSTNQLGPQAGFSTTQLGSKFKMYATEKADFYVATRQYDRALAVLEEILKNPSALDGQPHEQVSAIKKYLSLMVRVKKDPVRASQTLEMFLANGRLPYFVASDAESWLSALRQWRSEGPLRGSSLAQAQSLLKRADKKQSVGSFQAGYVENLRATASLHEALQKTKNSSEKAEIYLLLGNSYDIISDLGVWDLPELYFESCVRVLPKSNTAKKCFKNYEKTVILGFSGSAGIFIPANEQKKLKELKELAGL